MLYHPQLSPPEVPPMSTVVYCGGVQFCVADSTAVENPVQ